MWHCAKSVRYKGLAYSYVRNTAHSLRFRGKATSMSRTLSPPKLKRLLAS